MRTQVCLRGTFFQFLNLSGDHLAYKYLFFIDNCSLLIENSIVKGAKLSQEIKFLTKYDTIFTCTFNNIILIKNFTVMDTYIYSVEKNYNKDIKK